MGLNFRRGFFALLVVNLCAVFNLAQTPAAPNGSTTPAATPALTDPLHRTTPRDAVYYFLETCKSHDYIRAAQYLNLKRIAPRDRTREGPELAMQLEYILDRDGDFQVARLSDRPEGSQRDALASNLERIDSFQVESRTVNLDLEQVEVSPGLKAWVFSADSVAAIPVLRTLLGESIAERFEKHLPGYLVTTRFFQTSLWRWIALLLLIPAIGWLARLVSYIALILLRPLLRRKAKTIDVNALKPLAEPVGLLLAVIAYSIGVQIIAPSALVRYYITRVLTLLFFIAVAWIIVRLLDVVASRVRLSSDPRQRALFHSVLPLGLRLARIILFVVAAVATLSTWGYNTSTIWATLGVGSLAVALAAQKTLENFFGGVSVIGDRPVLVGDLCKVGDNMGTVEDIGLRSTRIRTLDRTLVTVPNSQFSTMTLENFAPREKFWFHPTITLRYDATAGQIRQVMASFKQILSSHPQIEIGKVPIRFTTIADYSYNIEIFAYVLTSDGDEFLTIQSDLLLKIMEAVEAAGTATAVPLREITGAATIKMEQTRTAIADPAAPESSAPQA